MPPTHPISAIALIGERSDHVRAHPGIEAAFGLAQARGISAGFQWVSTAEISDAEVQLRNFVGVWAVPGSPYASMAGALAAIRFARETQRPFLGTCGGFQHALIEYARNVAGWATATHAEEHPDADLALIARLPCSLSAAKGEVRFVPGTNLHRMVQCDQRSEQFNCNFGFNPAYAGMLANGRIRPAAFSSDGSLRAFEMSGHPFFVGTLFQPELVAHDGVLHPVIAHFLQAADNYALALAPRRSDSMAVRKSSRTGE